MSYEGYEQYWCKNGHYWTIDSSLTMWDERKQKCPICGEMEVFSNGVNTTNGSFDGDERIDGFIQPELISKHQAQCEYCNKEHICECSIYKIPQEKK